MNPTIEVMIELEGETLVVGTLWTRRKQGRESASFSYSEHWLQHPQRFALEPALQLGPGVMHTPGNKALFGALGDSAPDTWGRVLIRRAERQAALDGQRTPRTLGEAHYDPALAIESKQHGSQHNPPTRRQYMCTIHASSGACPRGRQRAQPEPKPGPPSAERSQSRNALTTCSRNDSRAAFTRPPVSSATTNAPAA